MRRSVAIVSPARLSIEKSSLLIVNADGEHKVPLEDLGMLVLDHEAIVVTGPLLGDLGERGIAAVFCNGKHLPSSYLIPYEGNVLMAQTLRAQIEAKRPAEKRVWQAIIKEKIRAQGRLLIEQTGHDHGLGMMAHAVASGDTTNREGVAANRYFSALFGRGFMRLRQNEVLAEGQDEAAALANSILNYGYAVLRACVARAIVGAGLHPALGVHHHHRNNAFSLADDLMEPLRPLVDRLACVILKGEGLPADLTPQIKRQILEILTAEVRWEGKMFPLDAALEAYAAGVRGCLLGESKELVVPSV